MNEYIDLHDLRIPADELDWEKTGQYKYCIYYSYNREKLRISELYGGNGGELVTLIKTREACTQLAESCKDDLELLLKQ